MRSNKPQSAVPSNRMTRLTGPKQNNYTGGTGGQTNIAGIMKKFKYENSIPQNKKIEREVTHMQRNTLLEPNNFIPQWEAGGEEKKEVSATLKALRQKYDRIHKTVQAKQQELDDLKRKLEKAGEEEIYLTELNSHKKGTATHNQTELDNLTEEHEFEKLAQAQYEHVLKRMKADLISSQLQSQDLKESMKSKTDILSEESEKQRKAKQDRIQAKMKLEQIMMEIDQDQRERQERILSLQKSITNKEEALKRRMIRVQRQQEIAEMAANENKDQNEIKMQEQFLVQRLFSAFLKKKMEKEMNKHYYVEDAFQKIRTATGFSDVNEIVHRFLTREVTYSQLLMAVSENERKIDNLRIDHEQLGARLHELQMEDDDDANNFKKKTREDGHPFSPEIDELDKKIASLTKEKEKSDELNKKVNLVYDQVQGWCQRVIQKADQQFDENIGGHEHKTLAFLFEKISEAVCKQLNQIIQEEDEDDRNYITAKDFMNDFATEEFLHKNIRVRPLSGVTRGEEDGKTNDPYNRSQVDPYGQNGDEDEKFAQMKLIEMDEQRREAKQRKEEYLRRKQLEEEKLAKKRR